MGVDAIHISGNFKVTNKNIKKFLDDHYSDRDDVDIYDLIDQIGWDTEKSRKEGIIGLRRDCEGWVYDDEFQFFKEMAPYVESGSEIIFEIIYGETYYERWLFEDGELKTFRGEIDIKWKEDELDYR